MWHLATHPEDRRRLIAEPELMPTAIEEFLRAYAPVTMARRLVEDKDYNGCPMKAGDRILVAESCTHHPIGEDIGRVKIPRWLRQYTGLPLDVVHVQGHDFPDDLSPFSLIVHCGSCMGNRREMLSRILRCRSAAVPITNYGLTIAYSLGILERALGPFPAALEAFRESRAKAGIPVEVTT